jgi:predicted acylesterase/phospholipase RssA/CRP-like cAMP-binding protein
MGDDLVACLKAHTYFSGIDDDTLRQIAGLARVSDYATGEVVHQLDESLTAVCFVLRGRLKAVRVDARGEEHLFRMFERGEQYGLMLGTLGEALPVRVFALEPATVLSLEHEQAMELMFQHPALRRQWLQTFASGMRQHFFETAPEKGGSILAMLHESAATRHLAQKLVQRLRAMGEEICVLSDEDTWRAMPDLQFRSLTDGDRSLDQPGIRRQIAEWQQAKRIVFDVATAPEQGWDELAMRSDRVLLFVRPNEIQAALRRLRALDVTARGWRDKISLVCLLDEGCNVTPWVPELRDFCSREFSVCESQNPSRWGHVLSNGMERLVHYLRGVRIGVALGGGAARGMSHLGVLKALERNGIVVDMIAGTSAGAMTGVVYSAGLDCDYSASQFSADLTPPRIFRGLPSGGYWYLLYKYRCGHFDPMLRKYLGDWKLEQLPVPCQTVSVDLVGGRPVVRERGDAVQAVLESINLPGLSSPICRNGQALVDGGLVNNIPADVLAAQGCNFVIAVSVTAKIEKQFSGNQPDTPTPRMRIPSTLRTLLRSLQVQNHNLNAIGVKPADVTIEPDVTGFDLTEFMRARELAAVGEQAALDQIPKIKQLLGRLDPELFPASIEPTEIPSAIRASRICAGSYGPAPVRAAGSTGEYDGPVQQRPERSLRGLAP